MKIILATTDFSKAATNAVDYAAELAKLMKARLILFNVCQPPIVPTDVPVIYPMQEMIEDTKNALKNLKAKLHQKHGAGLNIEYQFSTGFAVDEIRVAAQQYPVDLIVMGMQGAGYLEERLIGSVTTSLMRRSKYPVLAIHPKVKFKLIKKIVLAYDYLELEHKSILDPLKELADFFKSRICILNVVKELETVPGISRAVDGIKLDRTLESFDHSFHYSQNNDVTDAVNEFVDNHDIDMAVTISRKHSLLHQVLHESDTKRLTFHTKIPVLALHE